jgi:hypothetical protein
MKLNSLILLAMSGFAASAFAGTPAKAPAAVQPAVEDEPLGITLSVGYDTHYIFRGVEFAENLVWSQIDATVPLTDMLSLNVGAWYGTSADDSGVFSDPGSSGSFHELDLYAALLADLGPVTVGLKYTAYLYGGDADLEDINEVGITLATTLGPVDLIAGAYYDDVTDGLYFETGVSHIFVVTDRISIVPGALISFGDDYYGVSSFNHVKVGVSVPIKLTKTATLTPYIAYNHPLEDLDDAGEDNQVYGGVALSVSF